MCFVTILIASPTFSLMAQFIKGIVIFVSCPLESFLFIVLEIFVGFYPCHISIYCIGSTVDSFVPKFIR